MTSRDVSGWLPQVLIESVLIVISILVALWLDEWRDDRQDAENVQHALLSFISEIEQNKARIDDAAPFNRGLKDVISNRYRVAGIDSVDQFVNIIESYTPIVLQSTAWETALATGSLAKMDYNLVSALSLTYSLQSRYQLTTRSGAGDLTSPQYLSNDTLDLAVHNSIRYLEDITAMETELGAVYVEAAAVLRSALLDEAGNSDDDAAVLARDISHP